MGICCSRRRRRRTRDEERRALLDPEDSVESPPDVSLLRRVSVVLAALRAGKLPSQDQLDALSRVLIKSDALNTKSRNLSPEGQRVIQDVRGILQVLLVFGLEKNADDKLQDIWYNLHNVSPKQLEVDVDIEDTNGGIPSSEEAISDAQDFIESLRRLFQLAFTSAAFRLIVFNISFIIRQAVASLASDVGSYVHQFEAVVEGAEKLASGVEKAADDVESAAAVDHVEGNPTEPIDTDEIVNAVQQVAEQAGEDVKEGALKGLQAQSSVAEDGDAKHPSMTLEEALLPQVQQILSQAQSNPEFASALQTVVAIMQRYTHAVKQSSPDLTVSVSVENPILADLQTMLERLASGHSLNPTIYAFHDALRNSGAELDQFLLRMESFIEFSWKSSEYPVSNQGKEHLKALVEESKKLYTSDTRFRAFVTEASAYMKALQRDHTTHRLLGAFQSLFGNVGDYVASAISSVSSAHPIQRWTGLLWNDFKNFLLPNLVDTLLKVAWRMPHDISGGTDEGSGVPVPLPRVEVVNGELEAVVDGRMMWASMHTLPLKSSFCGFTTGDSEITQLEDDLNMNIPSTAEWLLPSSIRVERWEEVTIDMNPSLPKSLDPSASANTSSAINVTNKINLHLDNFLSSTPFIRPAKELTLSGLQYYANVPILPFLPSYTDEGELAIDLKLGGVVPLQGVVLDLSLDVHYSSPDAWKSNMIPDDEAPFTLKVTSATVTLPLSFTPRITFDESRHWMLNGMIEPLIQPVLKTVLKSMLEKYVAAGVEGFGTLLGSLISDVRARGGEQTPTWTDWWSAVVGLFPEESEPFPFETTVNVKGIKLQKPDEEDGPVITVGAMPQVVSSHAIPEPPALDDVVDEVEQEINTVKKQVEDTVEGTARVVGEARAGVEVAQEDFSFVKQEEARKDGWASAAFNF